MCFICRLSLLSCLLLTAAIPASAQQSKAIVRAERKLVDLYTGIYEDAKKLKTPRQKRLFLDSLEPVLETRFTEVLATEGAIDYTFPELRKKLRVVESADHRLRFFSWDTGLGDSMAYIQVIAQYRDEEGNPRYKVLKPYGQLNGVDLAIDYWEIDALGDSTFLAFGDGKYSATDRAISVSSFRLAGGDLTDTTAIFEMEAGMSRTAALRYSIQVCDPDELNMIYDADARTLCYPQLVMIVKDKHLGRCASGETICLLYDGRYFRKIKSVEPGEETR